MNNFIFKSPRRLVKKLSNTPEVNLILAELRHQRQDNIDIKLMLNRLLIDKHLQTQVDEYFEKDPFGSAFKESLNETPPQTDQDEL